MKILFIGEIFGRPGRGIAKRHLPALLEKFSPDCVIANAENLASGRGATVKTLRGLADFKVNLFTMGDHAFDCLEPFETQEFSRKIARPANFPNCEIGQGFATFTAETGEKLLLLNLLGRVFVGKNLTDCPFQTLQKVLAQFSEEHFDAVVLDFHAEATSEKAAMKFFADGKVSAILGSHTHVATCDAQVSQQGTFFVTDVGMSGAVDSMIGFSFASVWPRFFHSGERTRFEVEKKGTKVLQGFFLDICKRKVQKFERFEVIEK